MANQQINIEEYLEHTNPIDLLQYEHIDSKYRNVQMILTAIGYLLLDTAALLLLLLDDSIWCIAAESLIILSFTINMIILLKAWEFKGYALRDYDITYRSGILFPKTITVPYYRIQQVSVKQNPVSKMFNLSSVEVVNGAQGMASMTIPGLSAERADHIKNLIVYKLKHDDE